MTTKIGLKLPSMHCYFLCGASRSLDGTSIVELRPVRARAIAGFSSHTTILDRPSLMSSSRETPRRKVDSRPKAPVRPDFWHQYAFVRTLAVGLTTEVVAATAAKPGAECGRMVAVKRVARGCVGEPLVESWFAREASVAARLSHPNIVSVLDVCRDGDGRLCLVMEYIDGPTLAELAGTGPLPVAVAIRIACELLASLGYLHTLRIPGGRRRLIHGDVTPENVLLSRDGSVKLADFSLAGSLLDRRAPLPRILRHGSASHLSPEQLNEQDIDGRSDLFAVGAVSWELLTGVPLFTSRTPDEVAAELNFQPVRRLVGRQPDISRELEDIILRLLARDRRARYATAAEAIADFARCADAPRAGARDLAQVIAERTAPLRGGARDRQLRPETNGSGRGCRGNAAGDGCAVDSAGHPPERAETRAEGLPYRRVPRPPRRVASAPCRWRAAGTWRSRTCCTTASSPSRRRSDSTLPSCTSGSASSRTSGCPVPARRRTCTSMTRWAKPWNNTSPTAGQTFARTARRLCSCGARAHGCRRRSHA